MPTSQRRSPRKAGVHVLHAGGATLQNPHVFMDAAAPTARDALFEATGRNAKVVGTYGWKNPRKKKQTKPTPPAGLSRLAAGLVGSILYMLYFGVPSHPSSLHLQGGSLVGSPFGASERPQLRGSSPHPALRDLEPLQELCDPRGRCVSERCLSGRAIRPLWGLEGAGGWGRKRMGSL